MVVFLYIDPGSGSLLFQALLSALLTIAVFFKRIILYLKFIFKKNKTKEDSESEVIEKEETL